MSKKVKNLKPAFKKTRVKIEKGKAEMMKHWLIHSFLFSKLSALHQSVKEKPSLTHSHDSFNYILSEKRK